MVFEIIISNFGKCKYKSTRVAKTKGGRKSILEFLFFSLGTNVNHCCGVLRVVAIFAKRIRSQTTKNM
jgi:hypothetical protein